MGQERTRIQARSEADVRTGERRKERSVYKNPTRRWPDNSAGSPVGGRSQRLPRWATRAGAPAAGSLVSNSYSAEDSGHPRDSEEFLQEIYIIAGEEGRT